jgi:hypothetical protein
MDRAKPLSWFAIGDIHKGYCVHSEPHFPTWHRLYTVLYEVSLAAASVIHLLIDHIRLVASSASRCPRGRPEV